MASNLARACRDALALAMLCAGAARVAGAAGLPAEPGASGARAHAGAVPTAYGRCEDAVARSIRDIRGAGVQALRFEPASRAQDAEGTQWAIRGSGSYLRDGRGAVSFRYSCAYDEDTGTTSGVLLHESDSTPPSGLPVWHADVAGLALDACESEAAGRLLALRPRASGIVFDGGDRRLSPGTDGGTTLEGSGRYAPAAGVVPGAFHYRCDFDAAGALRGAQAG